MRNFDDETVTCPFDTRHRMPKPRLTWHLAKCQAKKDHEAAGLPVFRCRNNVLHIFLDEAAKDEHEAACDSHQPERLSRSTVEPAPNADDDLKVWDATKRPVSNKTVPSWGSELLFVNDELIQSLETTCESAQPAKEEDHAHTAWD